MTESEQEALRALVARTGRSRSDLIREAIDQLIAQSKTTDRQSLLAHARGLWPGRNDLPVFDRLRRELGRIVPEIE